MIWVRGVEYGTAADLAARLDAELAALALTPPPFFASWVPSRLDVMRQRGFPVEGLMDLPSLHKPATLPDWAL